MAKQKSGQLKLTPAQQASVLRDREIMHSLLSCCKGGIEEFEAGKTAEKLKHIYRMGHNKLKQAAFAQAMSED